MRSRLDQNNLWHDTLEKTFSGGVLEEKVTADLVIIGGGFTGCSAALHAAGQGLKVRLLEARTIAYGGSGRNVGLVNAGLWLPPESIQAQLGKPAADRLNDALMAGPQRVFKLIEKHAIACEATRAGTLYCAHSAAGLKDIKERYRQLSALGAEVKLLSAQQTAARTGSQVFHGALLNPQAGTIQPMAYCHGLALAAQAAGAHIHENSRVQSVQQEAGSWRVVTAQGQVCAASILLATNAYHEGAAGLPPPANVPVYFFQAATAPLDAALSKSILASGEGCWDSAPIMSSFRRDAAGRLILGGMGSLDHMGSGIHRRWVLRKLKALYPDLAGHRLEHFWCGRIAMTADHIPKIQIVGERGLSMHGYSGRGIAPGTIFGAAAVDALISGDYSELPLQPVQQHEERLQNLRQTSYEAAIMAYHLLNC